MKMKMIDRAISTKTVESHTKTSTGRQNLNHFYCIMLQDTSNSFFASIFEIFPPINFFVVADFSLPVVA